MAEPLVECSFAWDPSSGFRECHEVPQQILCNFTWNPLTGFRDCRELRPGPEAVATVAPSFPFASLYATVVLLVAAPVLLHCLHPVRQSHPKVERNELAEVLESRWFACVVMTLIAVDLTCTSLIWSSEYGYWNHEIVEMAEHIGFQCLLFFLLEQGLHLLAFGAAFFENAWSVFDLLIVSTLLLIEMNGDAFAREARLVSAVRVFKVFAFMFDVLLMRHEEMELAVGHEGHKENGGNSPRPTRGLEGAPGGNETLLRELDAYKELADKLHLHAHGWRTKASSEARAREELQRSHDQREKKLRALHDSLEAVRQERRGMQQQMEGMLKQITDLEAEHIALAQRNCALSSQLGVALERLATLERKQKGPAVGSS